MLNGRLRAKLFSGWGSLSILIGAVFLILVYLVGSPIICLLLSSLKKTGLPNDPGFTLTHYWSAYTDPYTFKLFLNSFAFSVGSGSLAIVLGMIFAWFLERTD